MNSAVLRFILSVRNLEKYRIWKYMELRFKQPTRNGKHGSRACEMQQAFFLLSAALVH